MKVRSLGYLVFEATDVGAWDTFGTSVLGMAKSAHAVGDALELRMDERPYRIRIEPGPADRLTAIGWELADSAALEVARAELEQAGTAVREADGDLLKGRRVTGLLQVQDPAGLQLELFCGPVYDHDLFISPVGVSRFVTGSMGLGHVVVRTPEPDETYAFYVNQLGFRLSDTMQVGGQILRFLHCNRRHHSVAILGSEQLGIAHFMTEAGSVDDVGRAYDRCIDAEVPVQATLGRHANDLMLSFYAGTPGGFGVEYGCGGIEIDDETWTSKEITQASLWGHKRVATGDSGSADGHH